MATRQYIGARYVPKFYQNSVDGSTQWQANVVYEPLVYVTLTNGNMYISKKQVPATIGTPAENIEYWLDVGNYNGQIESLQDQIDAIGDRVTDVEGTVSTTADDVAVLKTYHKRRYIFLSDSYGTGIGGATPWIDRVVSNLNLSSDDYVSSAVNGAAFGNNEFTSMINSAITVAQGKNWNATDDVYIVIGAGFNDRGITEGDLRNSMSAFTSAARAAFPRCTIGYAFIAGTVNMSYRATLFPTLITFTKVAPEFGIIVYDNVYPALPVDALMIPTSGDEIHPNDAGQKRISQLVTECILHGSCENVYKAGIAARLFGDSAAPEFTGDFQLINGKCRVRMGSVLATEYNPSTPISMTFNAGKPFIDIFGGVRVCKPTSIAYSMLTNKSGDPWINVNGVLVLENDYHIKFVPMVYGSNAGLENITSLYAPGFNFEFGVDAL